ncbi:MAG: hydrogenase, partial [Clostridiales bacterium]|nr:hydrogenase [Clostridiales bacterium]
MKLPDKRISYEGSKLLDKSNLEQIRKEYAEARGRYKWELLVCGGAGCVSSNCGAVVEALKASLEAHGLTGSVKVNVTGCMGICAVGPVMLIQPEGIFYTSLNPEKVEEIVTGHLVEGNICEKYTYFDSFQDRHIPRLEDISFFRDQTRIVLRNCGQMEYGSLEAYISRDGYFSIAKALGMEPSAVVNEIKASGLRGRGGAGFPTGIKWEAGMNAKSKDGRKFIVCNADEGDPGAFMDRSVLEGDPHTIIEGMMIGGYS